MLEPWDVYGLRVRRIRPTDRPSRASFWTPVRNARATTVATDQQVIPRAAIRGIRRSCGHFIRKLKNERAHVRAKERARGPFRHCSLSLRKAMNRCAAIGLRVGRRGLEPRTYGLKVRSSTIELATRARTLEQREVRRTLRETLSYESLPPPSGRHSANPVACRWADCTLWVISCLCASGTKPTLTLATIDARASSIHPES